MGVRFIVSNFWKIKIITDCQITIFYKIINNNKKIHWVLQKRSFQTQMMSHWLQKRQESEIIIKQFFSWFEISTGSIWTRWWRINQETLQDVSDRGIDLDRVKILYTLAHFTKMTMKWRQLMRLIKKQAYFFNIWQKPIFSILS